MFFILENNILHSTDQSTLGCEIRTKLLFVEQRKNTSNIPGTHTTQN